MKPMQKMVDMAITPEEQRKSNTPCAMPIESVQPIYPYGLCITLCQDELEKLNVDFGDWEVGDMFHLHAMAKITSKSENETTDGKRCRIEMQIVALEGEDEEEENYEAD